MSRNIDCCVKKVYNIWFGYSSSAETTAIYKLQTSIDVLVHITAGLLSNDVISNLQISI